MNALIHLLLTVIDIYWIIVLLAVIFSWLFQLNIINYHNPIARTIYDFTYRLTEPVFAKIRSFLPNLGGIDISPIIVLIALTFLRTFISEDLAPRLT